MTTKANYNKAGLRSFLWLCLAVFCIVFSSASRKLIERKVNPSHFTQTFLSKKIKDGFRNKHNYTNRVSAADHVQFPDNAPIVPFLFGTFISFALLFLLGGSINTFGFKEQHSPLGSLRPLYLRHRRLQV